MAAQGTNWMPCCRVSVSARVRNLLEEAGRYRLFLLPELEALLGLGHRLVFSVRSSTSPSASGEHAFSTHTTLIPGKQFYNKPGPGFSIRWAGLDAALLWTCSRWSKHLPVLNVGSVLECPSILPAHETPVPPASSCSFLMELDTKTGIELGDQCAAVTVRCGWASLTCIFRRKAVGSQTKLKKGGVRENPTPFLLPPLLPYDEKRPHFWNSGPGNYLIEQDLMLGRVNVFLSQIH
ncbi:hypothetical protein MJT46_013494 [Ovis ammon polii x Ovis aries]|nr:hypothetical protein MJT46_013494 [Ovis ammon polii x Ovis aries]